MGAVDQIIFLSRSTTTLSNSKTTMLSSLETLPHHILTTVLEYVNVFTLYRLERTSKTLRDVVEFNGYLKYVTSSGERLINPLVSTGEYSVHHAWDFSELWTSRAGQPKLIRFEPHGKFWKEWPMEDYFNNIDHEDDPIDRELNALVRETADKEAIRRAVIEMLVMLGSDAMLDYDV